MSGTDNIKSDTFSEPIKSLRYSKLLDYYAPCLTEKQREAAANFYNDDLSLGEIAENTGTTRQAVRDNIKRAEIIMTDLEDKLHITDRAERFYTLFDEMQKHLTALEGELKPGCNITAAHARAKHALSFLEENADIF
jgi:predicted DNA-binding protein YlxM (UPF0122 family)